MGWLLTLIPLILKYLLPLISAWLAARGHAALSLSAGVGVGASQTDLTTLYAAWSGIAAASIGVGETVSHFARKSAAGPITIEQIRKIIELIMQLIQLFLTPAQTAQIHSALAAAFPDEARHLGLRR